MDFLIKRPVSVIMAFLAFFVIGIVMYKALPVSLLPDIAIPQITVHATDANMSAREIENSIIGPIRRQLLQVAGLEEIKSEARDGCGFINMRFAFGTNTDYAYIEVNEKIDASMNHLPHGTTRPKAIKASSTDIPVFYLNIGLKEPTLDNGKFCQLCEVVENIIRRRVEQLPEVAMADMTGASTQCLMLKPDIGKMNTYGLQISDIDNALNDNNINVGSMTVKDGIYEYSVKVSTLLRDLTDVENIFIKCGQRYIQIKDVCKVSISAMKENGFSLSNNKRVVTLAVIKRSEEGINALKSRIEELKQQFEIQFPELDFQICRNQTELLDYTINNLKQNLILGFLLIFVVAILFMGGYRPSLVVGITMLSSIIITFVPFYIFGKSLNIISLSGLILVVGMMIDNALIVSENITQWHQRGFSLRVSCVEGTREMITPLLSSLLTTIAVFIPLVFIDGMAGAIFSDQAFAITAGLVVSYIVGIILLPVTYQLIMKPKTTDTTNKKTDNHLGLITRCYDKVFTSVMNNKPIVLLFTLLTLPLCFVLFHLCDKNIMPHINYNELTARIEWNQDISIYENHERTSQLFKALQGVASQTTAYIGVQDFMVDNSNDLSRTEAEIYWKTASPDSLTSIKNKALAWLTYNYPSASITFSPPTTIFEKIFNTADADIEIKMQPNGLNASAEEIRKAEASIKDNLDDDIRTTTVAFKPVKTLIVDRKAIELYNVNINQVTSTLENAINESQLTVLHSYSSYMPVCIAGNNDNLEKFIETAHIKTHDQTYGTTYIPFRKLARLTTEEDLKSIFAGKDGEYIPILLYGVDNGDATCQTVRETLMNNDKFDASFGGTFFSNQKMTRQLIVILSISLLLMYFILCAQFENFIQPLIVLAEIPIDATFALAILWACGESLNIMSGIGIIVSCGIIINDSILKIDTINELRKGGMELFEAVHTAGHRRLRAIIMTSLTTVCATLPILFTSDMGSELQRPLAITMISTMTIGTIVSLFVIPLLYTLTEKRK